MKAAVFASVTVMLFIRVCRTNVEMKDAKASAYCFQVWFRDAGKGMTSGIVG